MKTTGACFCGEVKYEISGKLRDARSCHCSMCRKAFNSPASACLMLEAGSFQWLAGEHLLSSYVGKKGFGLQFCKTRGSTLSIIYKGQIQGITLGCLNGDPDVELGMHIYVGSKAKWETIATGTPQFEEGPPEPPDGPEKVMTA